jgi:hypothetical protein
MHAFYLANGHRDVREQWLKVEITGGLCRETKQPRRQQRYLLSSEQVYWESVLTTLNLVVPLAPLMHNNVNDLILLTDIFSGYGHKFIDDLVKQLGVTAGIASYPRYKLAYGLFVLF